jgi:cell division protease FtsH
VHKISVISRGQALGYTISLPTQDKFLTTKAKLSDTMAMSLGGRAAEEIVFGEVTTGASNDLEKVTATAKQMVMRFGMSEKLGPRVFGHDHGQPFLGRHMQGRTDYSSDLAKQIDDEVRLVIAGAHDTARRVLEDHRGELEYAAEILLRRETIEREQFIQLLAGKTEEEVFHGAASSVRRPALHTRRHRRRAAQGARPRPEGQPAPARTPA